MNIFEENMSGVVFNIWQGGLIVIQTVPCRPCRLLFFFGFLIGMGLFSQKINIFVVQLEQFAGWSDCNSEGGLTALRAMCAHLNISPLTL